MARDASFVKAIAEGLNSKIAEVVPTEPRFVKFGYGSGTGLIVKDVTKRLVYYFEGDLGDLQTGSGSAFLPPGKGLELRDGKDQEGIEIEIRRSSQSSGNDARWEVYEVRQAGLDATGGRLPSEQRADRAALPTLSQIDVLRIQPAGGLSFKAPGAFPYTKPSTGERKIVNDATGSIATQVAALTSGQHQAGVVYFDMEAGVLVVATNTASTASSTLPYRGEFYDFTFANIAVPSYGIPAACIYIYYGQATPTFVEADIYRAYDPRPLFGGVGASGTSTQIATKTANYTLISSDYTILVDATGGAVTITLPTAASAYSSVTHIGKVYNIKKIDSSGNNMVIDGNGAETTDGAANITTATQWASYTLQSNGSAWFIL